MVRKFVAYAVLLLVFAGPAQAQLSSQGGPIQVEADRGEVLERQKIAIYTGNVDITQGDARLRAHKVTVIYDGQGGSSEAATGFGDLTSIIAEGEVFYVTPELKARGGKGTYDAKSETILLEGDVILTRGDDVATGDSLKLYLRDGRSVLDGGRIKTVLTSNQNDASSKFAGFAHRILSVNGYDLLIDPALAGDGADTDERTG